MSTPVGTLGGVSCVAESTYGTDPGSGYIPMLGISSSLGARRSLIETAHLMRGPRTHFAYPPSYSDGSISFDWSFDNDVYGALLKAGFDETSGASPWSYTASAAPDTTSLTVITNYGVASGATEGEYIHTGCIPRRFTWRFMPEESVKLEVDFIAQNTATNTSAEGVSLPSEAFTCMPDDFDSLTLGGNTLGFRSMEISLEIPYTGFDRKQYGGSLIKQPIPAAERVVTARIDCELDDAANEDTIAELADLLASQSTGALTLSFGTNMTFVIGDTTPVGDWPELRAGIQEFPLNLRGSGLLIGTVDSLP